MWRDLIQVHPAAELFPMMSRAELLELGRDIKENELRHPVVLWTPEKAADVSRSGPKENYLLDGRNRLEAVELTIDDEGERRELVEAMLYLRVGLIAPIQIYGDDDPYAYVVSANARRRHLTAEKKRQIIEALLRENPERSNRATADIVGVGHPLVAAVRDGMESTGRIFQFDKTVGADGKARPTRHDASEDGLKKKRNAAAKRAERTEINASEARIETAVRATQKLSEEELAVYADWFDAYREDGGAVFDKTAFGR